MADAGIQLRVLSYQVVVVGFCVDYLVTRGHQVRFNEIVVVLDAGRVGRVTARRAAGAVGSDSVVVARIGAKGIGGAHGDRGRFVAGAMNLSVYLLSGAILAIVAGGSSNHDADVNQAAHRTTNRIVPVRINRRGAQTHVDHANVVRGAITEDPVERGQRR